MSNDTERLPCSPEIIQRAEEEPLYVIDWATQVEGLEQKYRQTNDTDFVLMAIEAGANVDRQDIIFKEIARLEFSLKYVLED